MPLFLSRVDPLRPFARTDTPPRHPYAFLLPFPFRHSQLPVFAPDTILVAHRLISIPSDRKLELESYIYSFRCA